LVYAAILIDFVVALPAMTKATRDSQYLLWALDLQRVHPAFVNVVSILESPNPLLA
jgi:hypothetical protein